MKKFIYSVITFTYIFLLSSCAKEQKVVYYNSKFASTHKILIDDAIVIEKNISKPFMKLNLLEGKHTIKIDDGKPKEFEVENDNGILNIAEEDFVVYPIKFTLGNDNIGMTMAGLPNILVLDSVVVASQMYLQMFGTKKLKEKVQKANNGNKESELYKIGKGQIFIDKTWDFNIDEENPTTINEAVSSKTKNMTIFKKRIVTTKKFLEVAENPENGFMSIPLSVINE